MDNKKIGKLIASLRKRKDLTQQELGDMIGVGFRAVSKWECGSNLPDIDNMNELSKIFDITVDELLSGELNENKPKDKKKILTKIVILMLAIISITLALVSLFVYQSNRTYVYGIENIENNDYYVEGQVTLSKDNISIVINKLEFLDPTFSSIKIKNYEYRIFSNETFLFGYGYQLKNHNNIEDNKTIKQFAEEFRVNSAIKTKINRKEFIDSDISLLLKFIDNNDNEIIKEIEFSLFPQNNTK